MPNFESIWTDTTLTHRDLGICCKSQAHTYVCLRLEYLDQPATGLECSKTFNTSALVGQLSALPAQYIDISSGYALAHFHRDNRPLSHPATGLKTPRFPPSTHLDHTEGCAGKSISVQPPSANIICGVTRSNN